MEVEVKASVEVEVELEVEREVEAEVEVYVEIEVDTEVDVELEVEVEQKAGRSPRQDFSFGISTPTRRAGNNVISKKWLRQRDTPDIALVIHFDPLQRVGWMLAS